LSEEFADENRTAHMKVNEKKRTDKATEKLR
jgi:hypothetical protein